MALNFIHNNLQPASLTLLGRQPNLAQLAVFRRLRALLTACDLPGQFPLPPGRSGFEFISKLIELERFAESRPELNPDPYGAHDDAETSPEKVGNIESSHRFKTHEQFSPAVPYRSLIASRVKLTGTGEWPLADHLDGVLWLPYKEPLVLQHNLPVTWDGPNVERESYEENLALLKVWNAKGLLALFAESHPSGHVCRAFNAHKSALVDRQIGDRRWFNGSERHPSGPSAMLPAGSLITSIHVPKGCTLFGCTSDRRDFYHQSAVTRERAFTNMMPFSYPADEFLGTPALETLLSECGKPTRREVHGDRLGMQPRAILHPKDIKRVHAGFNSLFQGDHLGVEFALQSHSCLLRDGGLLQDDETILRGKPFPVGPVWQGVVIDDFFTVSCEPAGSDPKLSRAVGYLNTAEELYARHSILGSDEKTVRGDELFKIIGAEVNSTKAARDAGIISVAAPLAKRIALSSLSLRIAKLPFVSAVDLQPELRVIGFLL